VSRRDDLISKLPENLRVKASTYSDEELARVVRLLEDDETETHVTVGAFDETEIETNWAHAHFTAPAGRRSACKVTEVDGHEGIAVDRAGPGCRSRHNRRVFARPRIGTRVIRRFRWRTTDAHCQQQDVRAHAIRMATASRDHRQQCATIIANSVPQAP